MLRINKTWIAILYIIIASIIIGYVLYRIVLDVNYLHTFFDLFTILVIVITIVIGIFLNKEIKHIISSIIKKTTSDIIQLITTYLGLLTLIILVDQLRENTKTNKLSIRDQLYTAEAAYMEEGKNIDELNSIWIKVDDSIYGLDYSRNLLKILTSDSLIINSQNVRELYFWINGYKSFEDTITKKNSELLRQFFLYAQTLIFHIHNAFDYQKEGIISTQEWTTWKGLIRDVSAHPIILVVFYDAILHKYCSQSFAEFIKEELLINSPKETDYENLLDYEFASKTFKRDTSFIRLFYPDMFSKNWGAKLPKY